MLCGCPARSQQPVPEQLRVQVSRVSMHDYEALHYDKEQLKEACEWRVRLGALRSAGSPEGRVVGGSRLLTATLSSSRAVGHRGGPGRQRPGAVPRPHREAPAGEEQVWGLPGLPPPAPGSGRPQPRPLLLSTGARRCWSHAPDVPETLPQVVLPGW